MSADDLRARIAAGMPQTIADLERLVRIPSKGYPGDDPANVRASAEATRDIFVAAGVTNARLLELDGGHPAVFGQIDGPQGAPTVLLYAHHDVQPEGPVEQWDISAVRACGPRRTAVRTGLRRRQVGGRDPRRRAAGARVRRARHRQAPGRGRGRVLHRAPPRARAGERGSDPRRRGRDRRLRQLPDRRAHDHDEHPRRDRLRRAGQGAGSGAAQRLVRRTHPRRDHGAGAHHRAAPRRRRQRGDPGTAALHLGGRRLSGGGPPGRSGHGRRAADDRDGLDRRSRLGGSGRRRAGHRRPRDPRLVEPGRAGGARACEPPPGARRRRGRRDRTCCTRSCATRLRGAWR